MPITPSDDLQQTAGSNPLLSADAHLLYSLTTAVLCLMARHATHLFAARQLKLATEQDF